MKSSIPLPISYLCMVNDEDYKAFDFAFNSLRNSLIDKKRFLDSNLDVSDEQKPTYRVTVLGNSKNRTEIDRLAKKYLRGFIIEE